MIQIGAKIYSAFGLRQKYTLLSHKFAIYHYVFRNRILCLELIAQCPLKSVLKRKQTPVKQLLKRRYIM